MVDPYAGLAERYDLLFKSSEGPEPEMEAFFRRLVAEHRIKRVLDCACGTGHELRLMRSIGCQVVGSDVSPSMLAQAQRNMDIWGIDVPLHQMDYRQLPGRFEQPFDAVLCLGSSIAHMPDEHQALRAFRSMYGVLHEGGVLVLSQGTSDRQWREKPRFLLVANTTSYTRLFAIDYLGPRSARYHVLDVLHSEDASDLKVWSTEYQCVLLRDDQERLLRRAGFSRVDFLGSYAGEPYDKATSQRLITLAQR
ncbi:MAG: class I SAM-dependent methyltransferase [Anaerolineae bacterium]